MKKVLAVIAAAVLLLGFTACELISANEPKNDPVILDLGGDQNAQGGNSESEAALAPTDFNTWKQYILAVFSGYDIVVDDSKAYSYEIKFTNVADYDDWLEKWAEVIDQMAVYNANGMNEIKSMDIDAGSVRLYFNAEKIDEEMKIETWMIVVGSKKYDIEFKYLSLMMEYDMYYVKGLDSIYRPTFEEVLEAVVAEQPGEVG